MPFELLRWSLVLSCFGVSVRFLLKNLFDQTLSGEAQKSAAAVVWFFLVGCHGIIALTTKIYFFSYAV